MHSARTINIHQEPPITSPADPSGNIQLLVSLQQLLGEVAGQPWGYTWLPPPAIAALGNLLHASLLRRWGLGRICSSGDFGAVKAAVHKRGTVCLAACRLAV